MKQINFSRDEYAKLIITEYQIIKFKLIQKDLADTSFHIGRLDAYRRFNKLIIKDENIEVLCKVIYDALKGVLE